MRFRSFTSCTLVLLLFCNNVFGQNFYKGDTLVINSAQISIPSNEDEQTAHRFLKAHLGGVVFISSYRIDSVLFSKINQYRASNGLPALTYSERLDTLSKKILYWLHHNDETRHYSTMPQMEKYRDLMNVENIAYLHSLSNKDFKFDPHEVLEGWIKSPPHNKAMLADLQIGSASSLAKLTMLNGELVVEIFSVFECDHIVSKRELTNKYDELNKKLIQRPIKFKKSKELDQLHHEN